MSSSNGKHRRQPERAVAHVAAAERLAKTIIVGFEICEEVGVPLSQVQKIAVLEAALLEFDGLDLQLGLLGDVGAILETLRLDGSPEP